MSRQQQINCAWFEFVEAALRDDFPNHSVIFSEGDGPRPDKPYLTLKITGPNRVTITDAKKHNAAADKFRFETWRRYNISIQSYGMDHTDVLDEIILQTQNPDFGDLLTEKDIGVELRGNVTDITGLVSNSWEKRGSLDISFIASKIKLTNIGTIESAEIDGEIDRADNTKVIVNKFTVPEP